MRFAVIGAGSIGGYAAARLAAAGHDVALIARGAHVAALRRDGLHLRERDTAVVRRLVAVDAAGARGLAPVDVVVLGLKAHQLVGARDAIAALAAPPTTVLAIQNGIPWWYTHGHPRVNGVRLASVDPDGTLAALVPAARVVGGVAYWSASVDPPGTIVHAAGRGIVLGAPDGGSERVGPLAEAFGAAGFTVETPAAIRPAIWAKLLGNVNMNPISALARATVGEITGDPAVMRTVVRIGEEALAVAAALGDAPEIDLARRWETSPHAGRVRTSMLQDLDARRPLELGALVAAVAELGGIAQVPTPTVDTVLALASLLDRTNRAATAARDA